MDGKYPQMKLISTGIALFITMMALSPCAQLPTEDEFIEDFSLMVEFSYRKYESLPDERKERYLSLSREELEILACRQLWSEKYIYSGLRLFVALQEHPDLQARFAILSMHQSPAAARYYMGFYRDDFSRHLEWVAQVGLAINQDRIIQERGSLRTIACVAAVSAGGNSKLQMELTAWSIILGRVVREDELPQLRSDPYLLPTYYFRLPEGETYTRLELMAFLGECFPLEVWERIWQQPEQRAGFALKSLDYYVACGLLAGATEVNLRQDDLDYHLSIWRSLFDQWLQEQGKLIEPALFPFTRNWMRNQNPYLGLYELTILQNR